MKSEERFEQAVAAVRDENIDPRTVETAGERVWARLANEADAVVAGQTAPSANAASAGAEHRILGCEGFRELMPAYLAGALAEPKKVLEELFPGGGRGVEQGRLIRCGGGVGGRLLGERGQEERKEHQRPPK